MRIPMVEADDAPDEVREIYDRFVESGLGVYNVMKLWANDPAFLRGFEAMIQGLYADETLPPRYRELAWLRTSQLNECHY